jgi:hypothetical protein
MLVCSIIVRLCVHRDPSYTPVSLVNTVNCNPQDATQFILSITYAARKYSMLADVIPSYNIHIDNQDLRYRSISIALPWWRILDYQVAHTSPDLSDLVISMAYSSEAI